MLGSGLRIKENKEVYEGEVTELTPEETENQMGGYGKVISHVIIGLKTVKGVKQLKLDPTIYDSLQKERVQVCEFAALGMTCWPCTASLRLSNLSTRDSAAALVHMARCPGRSHAIAVN